MNAEAIRDFALSLTNVSEHFPFDEVTLVFKTNDKMFLLLPLDAVDLTINVKCDPEKAIQLRQDFPDTVMPGYHMNKKHWNTILIKGQMRWEQIKEMIMHSHQLVSDKKRRKK